ncbi:hypothetical protein [Stutzerimonas nitrititolerans]|uniref:hypothetical protein n=1 Tax=Stutzerimonas nitrititolerans TaxID=2482751 RepID=UPI0028B1EE39|nr:hypothetical protein [Stutzerimonas nitrititolerans]
MDDRELLELSAKAAAIGGGWGDKIEYHNGAVDLRDVWILEGDDFVPWNPLDDDGDALRLAAGLCLNVLSSEACVVVEDEKGVECIEYFYGPEDYTSGWRRAIVRAAAAIGRAM